MNDNDNEDQQMRRGPDARTWCHSMLFGTRLNFPNVWYTVLEIVWKNAVFACACVALSPVWALSVDRHNLWRALMLPTVYAMVIRAMVWVNVNFGRIELALTPVQTISGLNVRGWYSLVFDFAIGSVVQVIFLHAVWKTFLYPEPGPIPIPVFLWDLAGPALMHGALIGFFSPFIRSQHDRPWQTVSLYFFSMMLTLGTLGKIGIPGYEIRGLYVHFTRIPLWLTVLLTVAGSFAGIIISMMMRLLAFAAKGRSVFYTDNALDLEHEHEHDD